MSRPGVELLYWDGCPSHPEALAELRAALADLGRDDVEVAVRRVEDDGQARAEGFVGSPTIRVDGADAFPPDPAEPPALTCRIYRLADGRYSPTPDPAALRASLARLLSAR
ncbi:MAG TPA: hypothetical protein VN213_16245 [Solirubrobacteraceae bacterium]|nr:hypothetical protein [Solirubrobacteraceae bacterium]